jgi:hypothetical protein
MRHPHLLDLLQPKGYFLAKKRQNVWFCDAAQKGKKPDTPLTSALTFTDK